MDSLHIGAYVTEECIALKKYRPTLISSSLIVLRVIENIEEVSLNQCAPLLLEQLRNLRGILLLKIYQIFINCPAKE